MIEKLKGSETLKRKAKAIGEIAAESFMVQIKNPNTYIVTGSIVLTQAMIYEKEIRKGVLASGSVLGAIVGTNVVINLVRNRQNIKEA